ncbi:MAG TPA: hypothetical protein ENJ29_14395 [Bacteroidetes bacterium]|nr:hypothetical protein [Bacteroidota bacterium]
MGKEQINIKEKTPNASNLSAPARVFHPENSQNEPDRANFAKYGRPIMVIGLQLAVKKLSLT